MKGDLPPSSVDGETEAYLVKEGTCSRSQSISVTKFRIQASYGGKTKTKTRKNTEVFTVLSLDELRVPLLFFFSLACIFKIMNTCQFHNMKINFNKRKCSQGS